MKGWWRDTGRYCSFAVRNPMRDHFRTGTIREKFGQMRLISGKSGFVWYSARLDPSIIDAVNVKFVGPSELSEIV
jgi:hypothetical protein